VGAEEKEEANRGEALADVLQIGERTVAAEVGPRAEDPANAPDRVEA
jgi:hypothetical protein